VSKIDTVIVPEWPQPRGYANGTVARGRVLHVAGQIGWDAQQQFASDELVDQFAVALDNVLAVVRAAGGAAWNIAEMTIYVTDLPAYRAGARSLGAIWKERMGKHYPAMALVGVAGLVEPRAKVEIQAVAYLEGP
jgi:enamine deaminase RidA (YjgF/YER057c/UK114 family)